MSLSPSSTPTPLTPPSWARLTGVRKPAVLGPGTDGAAGPVFSSDHSAAKPNLLRAPSPQQRQHRSKAF